MNVGIRELRDGLSRHLGEVRAGHTLTVTDHGVPVARIIPVGVPSPLERLIAEGRVERARQPKQPAGQRVTARGTVSDLVAAQRR
ncbi:MAG: prevent-host-death protein [Actinobacteria bacterium 69-20]|nr:type II toxin-antitoxin system prevent-host-death family antitoxin [Actinomycetota bacterium]OJV24034.1 MAG: prevent-host-death protein [Actinobacteria bacterium 69-20]